MSCSGTFNNLCRDARPASLADTIRWYTPREFAGCAQFVCDWLAQCADTDDGACGAPADPSWEGLVKDYSRHPRRGALCALWEASTLSLEGWRSTWVPVMRAADFWDVPCLYWHMVYLCHERAAVLARLITHSPRGRCVP